MENLQLFFGFLAHLREIPEINGRFSIYLHFQDEIAELAVDFPVNPVSGRDGGWALEYAPSNQGTLAHTYPMSMRGGTLCFYTS